MRNLSFDQATKVMAFFINLSKQDAITLDILKPRQRIIRINSHWNVDFEDFKHNTFLLQNNEDRSALMRQATHIHNALKHLPKYKKALKVYDATPYLNKQCTYVSLKNMFINSVPSAETLMEMYSASKLNTHLFSVDNLNVSLCLAGEDFEGEDYDFYSENKCMQRYIKECKFDYTQIKEYLKDPQDFLDTLISFRDRDDDDDEELYALCRRFACAIDSKNIPLLLVDACPVNRDFAQRYVKYLEKSDK